MRLPAFVLLAALAAAGCKVHMPFRFQLAPRVASEAAAARGSAAGPVALRWVPADFPDRVDIAFMGRLVSTHEVSAVTAACLLMRKDAFDAIDGYDEKLAVGFGDVDLCLRTLQLGWRVLYCPQATLIHHESITRGKAEGYDPHPEDSALFASRSFQNASPSGSAGRLKYAT